MWVVIDKTQSMINLDHVVAVRQFDPMPEEGDEHWALGIIYEDGSRDILRYKDEISVDTDFMLIKSAIKPICIKGR